MTTGSASRASTHFERLPPRLFCAQLFAVLFFLMLFTLGVGSATALTGCIITVVCGNFPHWARWKVSAGICIAGFLIGLIYVTPVSAVARL